MKRPMTPERAAQMDELSAALRARKPEFVPADDTFKALWDKTYPTVLDQYLSELRRNDSAPPRIIGFMTDGTMGNVNLPDAFDGEWGNRMTKDVTAAVHRISAMVPGTDCACFVSETWMLNDQTEEEMKKWRGKSYADHPDRKEGVMVTGLRYDWDTNHMMQLMAMAEVIKVFANPRTSRVWQDTKYGAVKVIDPLGGKDKFVGRFVPSNTGDDDGS